MRWDAPRCSRVEVRWLLDATRPAWAQAQPRVWTSAEPPQNPVTKADLKGREPINYKAECCLVCSPALRASWERLVNLLNNPKQTLCSQ
jgi:hypothetical protein